MSDAIRSMDEFRKRYFPKQYEEDRQKKARDAYHSHLDWCSQCRNFPFEQCPTGRALLLATVPTPPAEEK